MTNIQLLKDLGMTEEQIVEKVVGQIADQMLYGKIGDLDYDEVECGGSTNFRKAVDDLIKKRIDAAVEAVAAKHTLPNVSEYLENLCLQKSNEWGEKKGEEVTFIEYLTQRADTYMREPVDHSGKSKSESGGFSWSKRGTRVEYMIDKHLQYNISQAMQSALDSANKSIVEGLKEAVNIKLGEIKVALDTKVTKK
ncbi:hypothetical protein [Celeribacter sp. SCSIO 80788]|uniref:hypothetical protein n=1 Tax=Celeribacter sp. SCSIO 80788 TaxID=3117013 RepID=UPI003DA2E389